MFGRFPFLFGLFSAIFAGPHVAYHRPAPHGARTEERREDGRPAQRGGQPVAYKNHGQMVRHAAQGPSFGSEPHGQTVSRVAHGGRDRMEDRGDRRENKMDSREDRRDRKEDVRDARSFTGPSDVREDRRDRREDVGDRREDKRDRGENRADRANDGSWHSMGGQPPQQGAGGAPRRGEDGQRPPPEDGSQPPPPDDGSQPPPPEEGGGHQPFPG